MTDEDNTKGVCVEVNCPRCNLGFMRYIGKQTDDERGLYVHRCMRCGLLSAYKEIYPVDITE